MSNGNKKILIVCIFVILFTLFLGSLYFNSLNNNSSENKNEKSERETLVNNNNNNKSEIKVMNLDEFETIRWGSTKEDVMSLFSKEDNEKVRNFSDYLQYEGEWGFFKIIKINDENYLSLSKINFEFANNQLINCTLYLNKSSGISGSYSSFDKLENYLDEKYGEPFILSYDWIDDYYKDSPENYNKAFEENDFILNADWETSNCFIKTHWEYGDDKSYVMFKKKN